MPTCDRVSKKNNWAIKTSGQLAHGQVENEEFLMCFRQVNFIFAHEDFMFWGEVEQNLCHTLHSK